MSISGNLLFVIGVAVLIASLVAAIAFICIYRLQSRRLNAKLNAEYGEKVSAVRKKKR